MRTASPSLDVAAGMLAETGPGPQTCPAAPRARPRTGRLGPSPPDDGPPGKRIGALAGSGRQVALTPAVHAVITDTFAALQFRRRVAGACRAPGPHSWMKASTTRPERPAPRPPPRRRRSGFAEAWQQQQPDPPVAALPLEDRLALLVEVEWLARQNHRLQRRRRGAFAPLRRPRGRQLPDAAGPRPPPVPPAAHGRVGLRTTSCSSRARQASASPSWPVPSTPRVARTAASAMFA